MNRHVQPQEFDPTLPMPFSHRNFEANNSVRVPGRSTCPCVLCGRPVVNAAGYLHVVAGGARFAKPGETDIDVTGDMSIWPIGAHCLWQHKELFPYLIKS